MASALALPVPQLVIGHSLSSCLAAIVRGDVEIESVVSIETSATFKDQPSLVALINATMRGRNTSEYVRIATRLHEQGKLVRCRGLAEKIREHGIWRSAEDDDFPKAFNHLARDRDDESLAQLCRVSAITIAAWRRGDAMPFSINRRDILGAIAG